MARQRIGSGDDLEDVLAALRAAGLGEISCIKVIRELFGVSLGHAKALVHFSAAFADRREANEALQDSLVDSLREINEINEIEQGEDVVHEGVERQLGDLRAALALTLRMVRGELGPEGFTLLSVPTDGEMIREVRRLRDLVDQADVQQQSTAADSSERTHHEPKDSL